MALFVPGRESGPGGISFAFALGFPPPPRTILKPTQRFPSLCGMQVIFLKRRGGWKSRLDSGMEFECNPRPTRATRFEDRSGPHVARRLRRMHDQLAAVCPTLARHPTAFEVFLAPISLRTHRGRELGNLCWES